MITEKLIFYNLIDLFFLWAWNHQNKHWYPVLVLKSCRCCGSALESFCSQRRLWILEVDEVWLIEQLFLQTRSGALLWASQGWLHQARSCSRACPCQCASRFVPSFGMSGGGWWAGLGFAGALVLGGIIHTSGLQGGWQWGFLPASCHLQGVAFANKALGPLTRSDPQLCAKDPTNDWQLQASALSPKALPRIAARAWGCVSVVLPCENKDGAGVNLVVGCAK